MNKRTEIIHLSNNWKLIKNTCRSTVNKEFSDNEVNEKFKKKLLFSEHSPIRLYEIVWKWSGIPYWVSTELSRHKFEKFISSQRMDRTGLPRDTLYQNAPVNFIGHANAQNLIDMSRKRLCNCATKECRVLVGELKIELAKNNSEIAYYMCPNCVYRGGCPEFKECGFWSWFMSEYSDKNLLNLQDRYYFYNKWFYDNFGNRRKENTKCSNT